MHKKLYDSNGGASTLIDHPLFVITVGIMLYGGCAYKKATYTDTALSDIIPKVNQRHVFIDALSGRLHIKLDTLNHYKMLHCDTTIMDIYNTFILLNEDTVTNVSFLDIK